MELDGEKWHGPDQWWADYRRQLALERMGWTFWRCWGSDWRLDPTACLQDLKSVLEAMGIRPGGRSSRSEEYTEYRVHESHPTMASSDAQISAEIYAEPGDAVEVEFCEHEPLKRVTYILGLDVHQPNNGVVRVDSALGRVLLGAAVGDDLQLPHTNDNVIVIGIFKGMDEPRPPSVHAGSGPSLASLSLH